MLSETGAQLIVVEQKGRDVWRGRFKSLHDAIEAGVAGIAVDRILLQRARDQQEVKIVMVVVEELRRVFLTPIEDFFDDELSAHRTNYQGRATRVVSLGRFHQRYLGPPISRLRTRSKTAS